MSNFADILLMPISMFSGKPLAVGIALVLLLSSLGFFLLWLWPAGKSFIGAFNAAAALVRKIRLSANGTQEERLARIDEVFEKSVLAANWAQYRACIGFADGRVSNYTDPEAFFVAERVPGSSYVKWSTTLGGIYLTLGLVFTFIGLSAALLQMGGDGQALDTEHMRKAVEGILAVSSAKFITSIAGILAYIGWTIVARVQSNQQESVVQALCRELRLASTFVSPETILVQQLQALRRQEEQFQTFGNDLAVAIGQQIEAALQTRIEALPAAVGQSVADAMVPIQTELNEIGAQIGRAGGELVGGANDAFSQAWDKGVGQHLDKFGDQMDKAIGALGSLPDRVQATETVFGSEIERTTRQLSETTQGLTESIGQTQKSIASMMEQFTARIVSVPEVIESASRHSASAVSEAIKQAMTEASTAAADASGRSISELTARVAAISESITESSQKLREAGDHSADALKTARDELKTGIKDGVGIVAETAKQASADLAQTVDSLAAVVDGLTACLASTATRIEEQNRRLAAAGETVGTASQKLSLAAGSVEAAASPLTRSASAIDSGIARLSEAAAQLKSASETSREVSSLLTNSLEASKAVSAEQARHFSELERAIKATIEDMIDKVRHLGNEISKCMETYDSEIAKSISSLETAILDVADIVDNRPGIPN